MSDRPLDPERVHVRVAGELEPFRAGSDGIADGLSHLCRLLSAELEFVGTTIALMSGGDVQGRVGMSRSVVSSIDDVQFDVGEGPSEEAFRHGRPVLVADLGQTEGNRWPVFASQAQALGVRSAYAFPLQLGAVRFGVLTCYGVAAGPLTRNDVGTCVAYADVATRFLVDRYAASQADGRAATPGFANDVPIRTEVYQAQGMVTVDLGVGLAEAMVRLRAAAFAAGVSLNDYSAGIVDGTRTLADDPTDPGPDGIPDPDGSDA